MSGTSEVQSALRARLIAASPGAAIPASSVEWENRHFVPGSARWYQEKCIPGIPRAAAVGEAAPNRHVGLYHINVFDPPGKGDGATITEAERIVAAFSRGITLTYSGVSVHILRAYVSRMSVQPDPSWFQVPIVIAWWADVSN